MKQKHTLASQHSSLGLAPVWMLKKRGKRTNKSTEKHPSSMPGCWVCARSKLYLPDKPGGRLGVWSLGDDQSSPLCSQGAPSQHPSNIKEPSPFPCLPSARSKDCVRALQHPTRHFCQSLTSSLLKLHPV